MRSQMAQFIIVTLRKVSLTLADHHIGITHAGDGRSQRITDFDRAAALDMSEEIEAEERARAESDSEKKAIPELPKPENMPRTPEPLESPKSIGGLAERAGVQVDEAAEAPPDGPMDALIARADDVTDVIEAETSGGDKANPSLEAITEAEQEVE